jgi:hypothetical protein
VVAEEENTVEEAQHDVTVDYGVQPGALVLIPVPDVILHNDDVDSIKIEGLEDGVSIAHALENPDGSFTISAHNESFVVNTSSEYTGELTLSITGYDSIGAEIEGLDQDINLNVSDENIHTENDAYILDEPFEEEEPIADIFTPEEVVLNDVMIDAPFAYEDEDSANDFDSFSTQDQY